MPTNFNQTDLESDVQKLASSVGVSGERLLREVLRYVEPSEIKNYHLVNATKIEAEENSYRKSLFEELVFEIYLLMDSGKVYSFEKTQNGENHNFNQLNQVSILKLRQTKDLHMIDLSFGMSGFLIYSSPKDEKSLKSFFEDIYKSLPH